MYIFNKLLNNAMKTIIKHNKNLIKNLGKSNIVNYKQFYENEKKNNEILVDKFNTLLDKKNKEINKLNILLDKKNEEIKEANKKILSYINSNTAKNGYKEENLICNDLNTNTDIKKSFNDFIGNEYNNCVKLNGNNKCDILSENKNLTAQVKKYKKNQFQQLDRHWIDDLIKCIPELEKNSKMLKNLCEYPLLPNGTHIDKNKSIKKICLTNYSKSEINNFIDNMNKNKNKILNYAFFGTNQEIQPEFLFGVEYVDNKRYKIVLFKIIDVINYLKKLDFKISTKKTVIVLGDDNIISMQRKGGDKGKKSSNQLQIKIIISKLINKIPNLQHIL